MTRTVLILGADGFIGRHLAFHLAHAGWRVIAHARSTDALAQMGFDTIRADLTDPACHVPAFWARTLAGGAHVINAAGLLAGTEATFKAVHLDAPAAVYAAMQPGARAVLISAIGIEAETPFARWRRAAEAATPDMVTILRPGLVLGATSFGGSSLARALAVLPVRTPVVGDGGQRFNPVHAEDLAAIALACLDAPPPNGPHTVGGPEDITQAALLGLLRRWMGLRPVPPLSLPLSVASALGAVGDALRLGPISRTSVAQLSHGVLAPMSETLAFAPRPRAVSDFVMARPAGSQDLWHARLYLMRPLLRMLLAMLWLASGLLGLTLPTVDFLPLVAQSPLPDALLIAMARAGGLIDLAIAAALLRGWRLRMMGWVQLGLVAAYTLAFSWLSPGLWLLPLGGLLKNIPVMGLIATWMILERER